jgi:hypothetical protein
METCQHQSSHENSKANETVSSKPSLSLYINGENDEEIETQLNAADLNEVTECHYTLNDNPEFKCPHTEQGFITFALMLGQMSSLSYLNIYLWHFDELSSDAYRALISSLAKLVSLKRLDISVSDMEKDVASSLGECLSKLSNLHTLNIGMGGKIETTSRVFVQDFEFLHSLQVRFAWKRKGTEKLMKSFKNLKSLKRLTLDGNITDDEGDMNLAPLASALESRETPLELFLVVNEELMKKEKFHDFCSHLD